MRCVCVFELIAVAKAQYFDAIRCASRAKLGPTRFAPPLEEKPANTYDSI